MTRMTAQRGRILALLRLTDDPDVKESDAVPTAEDLDAVGAIAFDWEGEQAHVSVYELDGYDEAAEAHARLQDDAAQTDLAVATTVNGDLLLWATAPNGDEAARRRIDGLASSFASR